MSVSRRALVEGTGSAAVVSRPRVGRAAEVRTPRFVPQANLPVLDPVFTTEEAPMLPLGQFFVQTAFREGVLGVRQGAICHFWNVRKI